VESSPIVAAFPTCFTSGLESALLMTGLSGESTISSAPHTLLASHLEALEHEMHAEG